MNAVIRNLICALLGTLILGTNTFAEVTGSIAPNGRPEFTSVRLEARAFEHGEGVPRDLGRAIQLYCDAARAGDAEAQFSLGWIYANGRGITRDDAIAALFFSLAAKQGHAHAERMLRYVGEPSAIPPPCMIVAPPPAPVAEANAEEPVLVATTPAQRKVVEMLQKLAPEYGVNPRLAFAVIRAESNFDPAAVSNKNAQGLMQLIPETSARFNVSKPFDPEQNMRGGLAYLRWLLAYFKGKVPLVAAAYNAGEGTVNRFKGIPPYAETQGYVKRIVEIFKHEDHPYDEKITAPSPEFPRIRLVRQM